MMLLRSRLSRVSARLVRQLEEAPFEAYARMMCDPTASVVPGKAIARLTAWLAADTPVGAA